VKTVEKSVRECSCETTLTNGQVRGNDLGKKRESLLSQATSYAELGGGNPFESHKGVGGNGQNRVRHPPRRTGVRGEWLTLKAVVPLGGALSVPRDEFETEGTPPSILFADGCGLAPTKKTNTGEKAYHRSARRTLKKKVPQS